MYRPTVRYNDVFRTYVDDLFRATHLDRNQIIRAALYAAAHSEEFSTLLIRYLKKDVPLPSPTWRLEDNVYWLEQGASIKKEEGDVNVKSKGRRTDSKVVGHTSERSSDRSRSSEKPSERGHEITRRKRTVSSGSIKLKDQGGISFTLN